MSSSDFNATQILEELVRAAAPAGQENRIHPRVSYEADVKVTEIDRHGRPQGTWLCKTSDLSRSGIKLISRRLVHMGREMLMEIETEKGKRLLFGVVQHCAYCEGLGHKIGIKFTEPSDNPTFRRWIAMQQSQ